MKRFYWFKFYYLCFENIQLYTLNSSSVTFSGLKVFKASNKNFVILGKCSNYYTRENDVHFQNRF